MAKQVSSRELITLAEAASAVGLNYDYLRRIAGNGRLKDEKIGRDWLMAQCQ